MFPAELTPPIYLVVVLDSCSVLHPCNTTSTCPVLPPQTPVTKQSLLLWYKWMCVWMYLCKVHLFLDICNFRLCVFAYMRLKHLHQFSIYAGKLPDVMRLDLENLKLARVVRSCAVHGAFQGKEKVRQFHD